MSVKLQLTTRLVPCFLTFSFRLVRAPLSGVVSNGRAAWCPSRGGAEVEDLPVNSGTDLTSGQKNVSGASINRLRSGDGSVSRWGLVCALSFFGLCLDLSTSTVPVECVVRR